MTKPDENDTSAQSFTTADSTAHYSGPPQTQGYPSQDSTNYDDQRGYSTSTGHQTPDYGSAAQPAPGYGAPVHGAMGYGAGQSAPGYPPNPGYQSPYGYPPYGYPMQRGAARPGGATASAVLMFIQAAVVLISTFYVLFGASVAGSVGSTGGSSADALQTEWTVIGVLQLVSVGLLIFGGVQLVGGNGRTLTFVAGGIQLALVVYWMIRIGTLADFDVDGEPFFFVIPLMYAVLPAVAMPLTANKGVAGYIEAKKGESNAVA